MELSAHTSRKPQRSNALMTLSCGASAGDCFGVGTPVGLDSTCVLENKSVPILHFNISAEDPTTNRQRAAATQRQASGAANRRSEGRAELVCRRLHALVRLGLLRRVARNLPHAWGRNRPLLLSGGTCLAEDMFDFPL